MKQEYLECGKIVTTHGVHGEVKVYPLCDQPQDLLEHDHFYLDARGEQQLQVEQARLHKQMVLLKFAGIDTPEQAVAYRNKMIYLHRSSVPMQPGEYFIADLIGLQVYDVDTGVHYGTLCDVSQTGANDVYHVRFADGKERYLPAIKQVVISVDLQQERMLIRPLKGLFDDAED